jgi:hypothetical protein
MFEDIERIVGETVFKENTGRIVHIGKAMLYRTAIIGYCVDIVSPLLSGPVLRLLPGRTKNFLRNIVYVSRDDKFSNLFEAEYVKEFISKYYAEDIKLYESLNKPSNSIIPNPSLI